MQGKPSNNCKVNLVVLQGKPSNIDISFYFLYLKVLKVLKKARVGMRLSVHV